MGAANEPRQARIRVERRLPLGVETKARSCRGCGRTFSTGSYTPENAAEAEIEGREGAGRGRATSGRIADDVGGRGGDGDGSGREETEERVRQKEKERRTRRSSARGWKRVYNATIAGCDRSCELRAGNLGVPVYANLRDASREWRPEVE